KTPAGVRVLVSLAWPTPAEPIRAVTGPSTAVQPPGPSSQAVSFAVVAREDDATTVTTCVALPGSTPRGRTAPAGGAADRVGVREEDVGADFGAAAAAAAVAASAAAASAAS